MEISGNKGNLTSTFLMKRFIENRHYLEKVELQFWQTELMMRWSCPISSAGLHFETLRKLSLIWIKVLFW
jgi:hypothetical protein